jgi:cytochrome c-type biogenesis protein CcmH/NrfG
MANWMKLVLIAGAGLAFTAPVWADDTTPLANTTVTEMVLPNLDSAKAMIDQQDYAAAARILAQLAGTDPTNPDIWNLFGFASRKMERMGEASQAYEEALRLSPDHMGALEYQGEMFVDLNRHEEALKNLDMLKKICATCEQTLELEAYILANPPTPL